MEETPTLEISQSEFMKMLSGPSKGDQSQQSGTKSSTPPPDEPEVKDEDSDEDFFEDNPELLAELSIEMFDILHRSAMQIMIGADADIEGTKLTVTEKQKAGLKKPLTKLIRNIDFNLHPGWILFFMFLIVYAPPTMKGISLMRKKQAAEAKGKKVETDIPKRPGRPPGSTKMAA